MSVQKPKTVRCAIYCSSNLDGGGAADQNAIRVQTKMLKTYLASQQANGWVCVPRAARRPIAILSPQGCVAAKADAPSSHRDESLHQPP